MATSKSAVPSFGLGRRGATPGARAAAWAGNPWLAAPVLFALAVLIRLPYLGRPPHFDEFYTLLAARGVLADGIPRIAEGVYGRAELYTRLVAWFFELFGESLIVARLPAVVAGSLLVVAVFLWTRAVAGPLAAWIAALFLCFSALSIEMAQFARFYALFGLAFWLGAVGVYAVATRPLRWPTRLAVAAAAALALGFAWYLQDLALLGMAGLGLWLAVAVVLPWLTARPLDPKWRWGVLGALVVLVLAAAALAVQTGAAAELLQRYLLVPMHMAEHGGRIWYYHLLLVERYPTFWPLLPFLALAALGARPRPVLFCLCVFGLAFLLLSFAGQKSWRYVFFLLPFLFVVWGIALAGVLDGLRRWGVTAADRALRAITPGLPRRPARWALIAVGLAFLAVSSGSSARTLLLPFGVRLTEAADADWAAAGALLEPWLEEASVVLTSHELHALYHLGRYDVTVSRERMFEVERMPEAPAVEAAAGASFVIDRRTGRPVVSTPAAVELLLDCYPDGLIVTDTIKGWQAPTVIDEATAAVIARRTTPIELPPATRIRAFWWERPQGWRPPAACATVTEFVHGR